MAKLFRSVFALVLFAAAGAGICRAVVLEAYPGKEEVDALIQQARVTPTKKISFDRLKSFVANQEKNVRTRQYALARIADLAVSNELSGVSDFLLRVLRGEDGLDPSGSLRHVAFLQYNRLRVYKYVSPAEQEDVLEGLLAVEYNIPRVVEMEEVDGISAGVRAKAARDYVREWAATQLCDRGSEESLPLVLDVLREAHFGDLQAQICKRKIIALRSSTDRISGLEAALRWDEVTSRAGFEELWVQDQLQSWAITQLADLADGQAENVLLSYRKERISSASLDEKTERRLARALLYRGWSAERLEEAGFSRVAIATVGGYSR